MDSKEQRIQTDAVQRLHHGRNYCIPLGTVDTFYLEDIYVRVEVRMNAEEVGLARLVNWQARHFIASDFSAGSSVDERRSEFERLAARRHQALCGDN
jgi:hypothetical protein